MKLNGFDRFENRVIYVKIEPSEELEKLRLELVERLEKFCDLPEYDYEWPFIFHATLVLNDIQRKFDHIWEYLQTWEIPRMDQFVVRITILTERRRILAEYDILQRKILNRREALDRKIFHNTIKKLKENCKQPEKYLFEDVINKKMYVFSDAHFDHGNIIRYCHRPFYSAKHMNRELLANWNHTVKGNERIYYLGDMSFGRHRHPIDYWLRELNGKIFYIRGNHDKDAITYATIIPDRYGIKYGEYEFLLMHHPHRPFGYDGWIIHGDKHNNDLKKYPFINHKNKTINVCAELVNYTPLDLDRLILLIETGRSYKTIDG